MNETDQPKQPLSKREQIMRIWTLVVTFFQEEKSETISESELLGVELMIGLLSSTPIDESKPDELGDALNDYEVLRDEYDHLIAHGYSTSEMLPEFRRAIDRVHIVAQSRGYNNG